MAKGPLVKVRTGPSSYLKMTEQEAASYRATVGEYGIPREIPGQAGDAVPSEHNTGLLPDAETDYESFTVPQLQAIADGSGIDVKGMKKAEIIAALQEAETELPAADADDAEPDAETEGSAG